MSRNYEKIIPLIVFVILFSFSKTYSQDKLTQTIRGTIIDKHSKSSLPGANILLLETSPPVGTTTDITGNFRLAGVPVGRHGISVSFLGYNAVIIPNLIITSGKETVLTIELEEKIITGQEVVIVSETDKDKALNEMATVSARTFSVEEASRFAGSFNDPARRAANYAGVNGSTDQRNDIIIRGNAPTGLLWKLEGMDIPNPNHFAVQGTNGGPVSILNNNMLDNSDFFTGAFPAEYGNAFAGVFDLKMRKGNNEQHEYIGQIGLNGMELLAEGPFNKNHRSSYLASYRYSTLDLFNLIGLDFGAAGIPRYQDLSFKMHFPTLHTGVFSVFGIGGLSNITVLAKNKEDDDNSYGLEDNQNATFGSDMGAIGASHVYFFNTRTHQKIIIGISGMQRRAAVDTLDGKAQNGIIFSDKSKSGKITVSYYLNKKFSPQHTLKTGVTIDHFHFNLNEKVYDYSLNKFRILRQFKGDNYLVQSYIQSHYRFSNLFTINTGIHFQHYFLNNTFAIEPRVGLRWEISPEQSLNMGYGYHSQLQMMEVYFYESSDTAGNLLRTNEKLEPVKSHHFVVGYDRNLTSKLRLKTEIYYQLSDSWPVHGYKNSSFSAINLGTDFGGLPPLDSLGNGGTGKNYGVELTLEKFFSKGYYYLITGSIYDSKYKASDGVERNTIFNGNYIFNTLGGKEFQIRKSNTFAINGKFTWAGGKRFTPIDIEESKSNNKEVKITERAFSERLKDYVRFDLKIDFRHNAKKVTHSWSIDVQNVFNHKNILIYQFSPQSGEIETEYQLGIFPVVQYQIEF